MGGGNEEWVKSTNGGAVESKGEGVNGVGVSANPIVIATVPTSYTKKGPHKDCGAQVSVKIDRCLLNAHLNSIGQSDTCTARGEEGTLECP